MHTVVLCFLLQSLTLQSEDYELTIQVTGLKSSEGQVQIAIFNSAESFLEEPVQNSQIKLNGQKVVETTFTLPEGQYAVAVYHDENENGELDKNFLGTPTEAYGFSNDTRETRLRAPFFKETSIALEKSPQTLRIAVY
ncbi:MAG: DUF2141 domain-containing protein [Bacteroidota bacterium]